MNAMRVSQLDAEPVTYEEYLRWPETNVPTEFVDGYAIVSPAPGLRHQDAIGRLHILLHHAVPPGLKVILSPIDWVLRRHPLLVRQPDLAVIDPAREPGPRLTVPPVLAVEVLSPTSRERDLISKRAQYAEAGLDWYWLVDLDVPEVAVLRRRGDRFEAVASAQGDELLHLAEPFPVELRPADLAP